MKILKKYRLKRGHENGSVAIEFALIFSTFIFFIVSILELSLIFLYQQLATTALNRGLNDVRNNMDLANFVITQNIIPGSSGDGALLLFRSDNGGQLFSPADIESSIPDVLGTFVENGALTFTEIDLDLDFDFSALYGQKQYSINYRADWQLFSPILRSVVGDEMPINISMQYNDY